jgi:hypothetical protein
LDQRHQSIGTKRLDQMMIKPCFLSVTAIFWLPEPRNGCHQWLRRVGLLAQPTQYLVAVYVRQTDVQKYQMRSKLLHSC